MLSEQSSQTRESPRQVAKTFRVDANLAKQLESLAEREGVSLNLIVNRLFRKYVEWDSYAEKFGFQSVSGSLLRHLLEPLSEKDIQDLGKWWAENRATEYSQLMFGVENLETMVNVLTLMSEHGRRFDFQAERKADTKILLILSHGLGPKWSELYAAVLKGWLGRLKPDEVVRSEVKYSENQIVASITTPKRTGNFDHSSSQTL